MKTGFIILLCLIPAFSFGQTENRLGIDCNPKLNRDEINFFKSTLGVDTFDFNNKSIGFAINNGSGVLGFGHSFMPITKKEYFKLIHNDTKNAFANKLLILDSNQQQTTRGFSAILLIFKKKNQEQAAQNNFRHVIVMFGYRTLNYPDNIDRVGNDSSLELTPEDAIFFNQIFQAQRTGFDFSGRKIAFVNTSERGSSGKIKTRKMYIDKTKKHLENDFLYPADNLYILNNQEKNESGGYDAIIIYQCLKCYGKEAVEILKKSRSW